MGKKMGKKIERDRVMGSRQNKSDKIFKKKNDEEENKNQIERKPQKNKIMKLIIQVGGKII